MKKKKTYLKNLYSNNKVKTACWTIADCLIVIVGVSVAELNGLWVAPLTAILAMITKEINKRYL